MELNNNSKKKKEKLIEYKHLSKYETYSWKKFTIKYLERAICFIIPILFLIPIVLTRNERKEFDKRWLTEESKEYIILGKDQLVHEKSSTDLVFLVRCKETGKTFDITVTRGLYLSKNKGDHVWFKLPRHRFLMSEEEWDNTYRPGSFWIVLLVIFLVIELPTVAMYEVWPDRYYKLDTYRFTFTQYKEDDVKRGLRIITTLLAILYSLFIISIICSIIAIILYSY